jgi:hypothetical protein
LAVAGRELSAAHPSAAPSRAQASVRPFPRRQISLSHYVTFFGSANAFREPH